MQFAIEHRDAGSQARAGVLHLAHGEVRTPAFVPLATKGTVKTLLPAEVAALGYDIVLGNTFHLMLEPGPEVVAAHGGLHGFMGWPGPIITDSGGFQVFSMGHGTVADEIKGRASQGAEREGAILAIKEEGVRFRSYTDGRSASSRPRARWRCRRRSARTSRSPSTSARPSTSAATTPPPRPSAPTAGCAGAWTGTPSTARPARPSTAIVQGGVYEDLRRASAQAVAASGCEGIAIGGSLGAGQGPDARGRGLGDGGAARGPSTTPARDRRDRRPDPGRRAGHRHVRLRHAHADRAPRHGAGARAGAPAGASTCSTAASATTSSRSSPAAPARRAPAACRAPTCATSSASAS